MQTRRLTRLAMLAVIALTIFIIELRIPNPFPIPGVKLGLANIVTVYAVYRCRAGETLLILLTRILLGALFAGNIMSLLYSMAGGMLCFVGMLFLRRGIPERRMVLASIAGAVLHNLGQIAAAVLITRTPQVLLYFPILLLTGCLAGTFTGLCVQAVARTGYWGQGSGI